MAIHTRLPIYKVAYDLLRGVTEATKDMPRDFKASIGAQVRNECVLRARHYIRYVDDFILLHEDPAWLNAALEDVAAYLPRELGLQLNTSKTILQPVSRGVDFVGQVVKPWSRRTRRRTFHEGLSRLAWMPAEDLYESANSYFGLLRQAEHSHGDRVEVARLVRRRGHAVSRELTKSYRRPA